MRTWEELHDAAKLCFQDMGAKTLYVHRDSEAPGEKLICHKYGVHGVVNGLVFGTDMSSESDEARKKVDERLRHYGY